MDMSPKEYQAYVKQKAKKSPIVKDVTFAFLIGEIGRASCRERVCQYV